MTFSSPAGIRELFYWRVQARSTGNRSENLRTQPRFLEFRDQKTTRGPRRTAVLQVVRADLSLYLLQEMPQSKTQGPIAQLVMRIALAQHDRLGVGRADDRHKIRVQGRLAAAELKRNGLSFRPGERLQRCGDVVTA